MTPDAHRQIVTQIYEAFNAGPEQIAALLGPIIAPDATYNGPEQKRRTGKNLVTDMKSCRQALDARIVVDELIADDDSVSIRWTMRGVHKSTFLGLPPSGNRIALTGTAGFRFMDGRVVEYSEDFDPKSLVRQLGVMGEHGNHSR